MKSLIDYVTTIPTKSEVVSWERKCVALAKLIQTIKPYEDQILEILMQRRELADQIEELRSQMVLECIHPKEHLVEYTDHILCKFCGSQLYAPHIQDSKDK